MIKFKANFPDGSSISDTTFTDENGNDVANATMTTLVALFNYIAGSKRYIESLELFYNTRTYHLVVPKWKIKPMPVIKGQQNILFFADLSDDRGHSFVGYNRSQTDPDFDRVLRETVDHSRGDNLPGVFVRRLYYLVGAHWMVLFDSDEAINVRKSIDDSLTEEMDLQRNFMKIPDSEILGRMIGAAPGGRIQIPKGELDRMLGHVEADEMGEDSLD